MSRSSFKVAIASNRVYLRIFSDTGGGIMHLEKKDSQLLLKLLEEKDAGTVNCYNGGKLEATLEVTVDDNGNIMLTGVDGAGREESYPMETGGTMFRAACASGDQLSKFVTDLATTISSIPD